MAAALSGSDKSVELLLGYGVDPDMVDYEGRTALVAAIMGGVNTTVGILARVTTVRVFVEQDFTFSNSVDTLGVLARYHQQVEFSEPLVQFIKRSPSDVFSLLTSLKFGATQLFKILCEIQNRDTLQLTLRVMGEMFLGNAIESDDPETCRAVLQLYEDMDISDTMVQIARSRGNKQIITMLTGEEEDKDAEKLLLKEAVMHKTADILDLVPAFVEFEYHNKTEMLLPLLREAPESVPFSTLLEKLHMKEVHDDKCSDGCPQKAGCQRMRQVRALVERLAKKLESKSPFYKGITTKMVGSLSERARVFHMDEMDIHFWFDEKKRHQISFDAKTQRASTESSLYRKDNNELDTERLFFDFLENIYEILPSLEVSPGMKSLSTVFTPCLCCMRSDGTRPETVRCRHRVDCRAHDDSCNCREFTSPSLTHTRSGAVLHLEWNQKGGAKFNVDVDLVPILPTSTPYNGDITSVANALASERPVGWLEELGKIGVESMGDVIHLPHLKGNRKWHLNLRLINRSLVMTRQVTGFKRFPELILLFSECSICL